MDSSPRSGARRGFTLVEVAVVLAIMAVLAALAYASISKQGPRARLASGAAELNGLLHVARLTAMADSKDVVVVVFPQYANPSGGTGRVVVYEDGNFTFFSGTAAVNFGGYAAATPAADTRSTVLEVWDVPRGVQIGGSAPALNAPLAGIDVSRACAFCSTSGDQRGAVRFDSRGRAWFYAANGAPTAVASGSSLSLAAADQAATGSRTIVLTNTSGAIRILNNG